MKWISLLFLLPSLSWANVGFVCPKLKLEITVENTGALTTLVMKNTQDRSIKFNERLSLPADNSTESYQERVGTYYGLMAEAHLHFPYLPGPVHVGHVMRSTNLYKKGFKAFEGNGPSVELSKMYCKALVEAIEKY